MNFWNMSGFMRHSIYSLTIFKCSLSNRITMSYKIFNWLNYFDSHYTYAIDFGNFWCEYMEASKLKYINYNSGCLKYLSKIKWYILNNIYGSERFDWKIEKNGSDKETKSINHRCQSHSSLWRFKINNKNLFEKELADKHNVGRDNEQ